MTASDERAETGPDRMIIPTSGALADAATLLAGHALAFGRINRTVCRHPDGTPESDSDHTVMLAWLAPALAAATAPKLDPLLVAAYAVVHDAPEVFAGDTPTLRISDGERQAKAERERKAVMRWHDEFGGALGWLPRIIADYETQAAPEARFVRALDKACPKFLHVINGGRDLLDYGMTSGELEKTLRRQREDVGSYAGEFTGLLALYDEMAARAVTAVREAEEAGS